MDEPVAEMRRARSRAWAVTVLTREYPHHASSSGYARVVDHLRDTVPVETVDGSNFGWIPSRLCRSMARRSGSRWYSYGSFRMEVEAMLRLFSSRDRICHVLYAENDLRYLGAGRSIRRQVGGVLAATYHQPPSLLEQVVDTGRSARGLDAAIALASNQVPFLISILGKDRVFQITHGVETSYFAPPPRKDRNRRTCLFVGGWLRDIEMLEGVIACVEAADPSITFRLVVRGERERSLAPRNAQTVHSLSDADLLQHYRSSNMLVLPYIDCVASNSLLEAMACGLPIVTTEVGGICDYVTQECAFTVPPGDVEAMSQAILRLAGNDALCDAMGSSSRERAIAFDWATVARSHMNLYTRLVA